MDPSLQYWLRWGVVSCYLCVLGCLGLSAYLLRRYEGPGTHHQPEKAVAGEDKRRPGVVYDGEAWMPCLHGLHPRWLLTYRLIAFLFFGVHNMVIASTDGTILYYYTEWTFTLVTVYFGLATLLSLYGCIKNVGATPDVENGGNRQENRDVAGFWTYLLQIIYQANAGAVMLTDTVFWLVIFPYNRAHHVHPSYMLVIMHSLNAVFLLGDAALHSLPFPWFRIAYFFLWTSVYVVFEWIVHAKHNTMWPYPFLDLSWKLAPLWYVVVGLLQVPCYMLFFWLVVWLKPRVLSKWFPGRYIGG